MTDEAKTPEPAPTPVSDGGYGKKDAPKPARKPRKWRRRFKIAAITMIALVILVRINLSFIVPAVVDTVASDFGLTVAMEDIDFVAHAGEVRLSDLRVYPRGADGKPSGDALLQLEYAIVDLDISALFSLALRVHRLEVDGLDLQVERNAEGKLVWAEHLAPLLAPSEEPTEEPEAEPEEPSDEPIDLRLPLRVDAIRAQHVRVFLRDQSVEPKINTWLEANVRISNLGAESPARIRMTLDSPDLVHQASVEGVIESAADQMTATFDLASKGMNLQAAAPWLEPLGVFPGEEPLAAQSRIVAELTRNADVPQTIDASLTISDSTLAVGTATHFGVKRIAMRSKQLGGERLWVPEVTISGVRGEASREKDGTIRVAGIGIRPVAGSAAPVTPPPEDQPAERQPAADSAEEAALALLVEKLQFADAQFVFTDAAIKDGVKLELACSKAEITTIDTSRPDQPIQISAQGSIADVIGTASITGTALPFAAEKSVDLALGSDQITLQRVRPYLEALGIEPKLRRGQFQGALTAKVKLAADGGLHAEAAVRKIQFRDAGELFGIESIEVTDVQVAKDGALKVGRVGIQGGNLPIARLADGQIATMGLQLNPNAPAPTTSQVPAPAATPSAPQPLAIPDLTQLPKVEVGEIVWRGLGLQIDDLAVQPATKIRTTDFEASIRGIVLGDQSAPQKAEISLRTGISGIAGELAATGSLAIQPGPLDLALEMAFRGRSLSLQPLAPYFEGTPIEPRLEGGAADARLSVTCKASTDTIQVGVEVNDVAFGPEGEPAVTLAQLHIKDIALRAGGVKVGEVLVAEPTLRIHRDAKSRISTMGVRFDPNFVAAKSPEPTPAAMPASGSRKTVATTPATTASTPFVAELGSLVVRDAKLALLDEGIAPAITTNVVSQVSAATLSTAPSATPATFRLEVAVPKALESAKVSGQLVRTKDAIRSQIQMDSRGLTIGDLAGYLPEGITFAAKNGRASARVDAEIQFQEGGAQSVRAEIADIVYRDGDGPVFAGCENIKFAIRELDPNKRRLVVSEVSVKGAELAVHQSTKTKLEVLGWQLDLEAMGKGAPQPEPQPAVAKEPAKPGGKTGERNPWHVTVEKLDAGIARLQFREAASKEPLVTALRIFNEKPLQILDREPEELAPIELSVAGQATPLVEKIAAKLTVAPWRPDAEAKFELNVSGIRGGKLPSVLSQAADGINLNDLENGAMTAKGSLLLRLRRRYPTDLDLNRGFGVSLEVTDVALREKPAGDIILGIDGIRVEAPRISLDGGVHVSEIELTTPRARVHQGKDGLHVAGLTIPNPDPKKSTPPPTTEPATEPAPSGSLNDAVAAIPIDRNAPEMRIDQFTVSGLDVIFRDTTADPPVVVPLTGLDVELNKLTTKALSENRPITFSAHVQAGKIELPERHIASSALIGALTEVGKLATGQGGKVEMEQRPLLDEIAVQGRLALFPDVRGRIRTNIQGFELGSVRGAAKQAGVDLSDGVFDMGVDVRLDGKDGINTQARFNLGYLSLDEEPGGPISTYLKLPAPLNAVVFALRDESDEIAVPLNVSLQDGQISLAELSTAALTTFTKIVASAVAAAPLRVAGSVTGLLGLTGGEGEDLSKRSETLSFDPGAIVLSADNEAAVERILALLAEDEAFVVQLHHQFAQADLDRAQRLANPDPVHAREIAKGLRQKRRELARRQAALVAESRSHFSVGDTKSAERAHTDLQRLLLEQSETEDALDFVLALLRPGAERRADRRTRKAALGIGNRRLERIRDRIVELGGKQLAERIELRRAKYEVRGKEAIVKVVPRRRTTQ